MFDPAPGVQQVLNKQLVPGYLGCYAEEIEVNTPAGQDISASLQGVQLSSNAPLGNSKLNQRGRQDPFSFKLNCIFRSNLNRTGMLVLRPGIEPAGPAVEVWSFNYCTSRKVPETGSS